MKATGAVGDRITLGREEVMGTDERRRTARHRAGENRARLEWAEGGEFRHAEGRLIDLSQGGARVVADVPPLVGRPVWFRLEEPVETGWISAQVIRVSQSLDAGLKFSSYCPDNLFRATTGSGLESII
jgi:hypothetical protein